MFLAWVELRVAQQSESDRATSQRTDANGAPQAHAAGAPPSKNARCGLVEKEFPGLQAAQVWATTQLTQRPDVTGNVAVFETEGPLVRLAWRPHSSAPNLPLAGLCRTAAREG